MKRTFSVGLVAAVVGLAVPAVLGQTKVGGPICTDTTWDAAGNPYIVNSSILVTCGATLTINPGVELRFETGLALTVGHGTLGAGTLVARGTQGAEIRFTSIKDPNDPVDPAGPGDWAGVYFTDYTVDAVYDPNTLAYLSGSIMEHVIIEYAGGGVSTVKVEYSSPYLTYCEIRHNAHRGIYVDGSNAPPIRIENCEIWDNTHRNSGPGAPSVQGGGIYLTGAPPAGEDHILTGNFVHDCSAIHDSGYRSSHGGGIYVNSRATLHGNVVSDNTAEALAYESYARGGGDLSVFGER